MNSDTYDHCNNERNGAFMTISSDSDARKTDTPTIAVLIPCFNEEAAIVSVIESFQQALPASRIYVCDNNSTDRTIELARAAGATVMRESLQGKGHALRRLFADVQADVYILVDGDNTYDPTSASPMVNMLIDQGLDMVTGTRVTNVASAYRRGHLFGNRILTMAVTSIFGERITDMLSGYRVFSRRFVKSFPALSSGFETETEFTVHALELDMPLGEIETRYRDRPLNSTSKLRTYRDGVRILLTIVNLIRDQKPLPFFALLASLSTFAAILLSIPIFTEFHSTHTVPRFPTAILCVGLMLLAGIFAACGLILDSVSRGRKEFKRIIYLSIPVFRSNHSK